MRLPLATPRTFCAIGAAFAAISTAVQAAAPSKPAVKHAAKPPAKVTQTVAPAPPIAPWPPVKDMIGSPILPTSHPNVFVRFAPGAPAQTPADASIYRMPGSTEPLRALVPRAVQKPFVPMVGDLPNGGRYALVDPANMDYMVARIDPSGKVVVTCEKPFEAGKPGEGNAK